MTTVFGASLRAERRCWRLTNDGPPHRSRPAHLFRNHQAGANADPYAQLDAVRPDELSIERPDTLHAGLPPPAARRPRGPAGSEIHQQAVPDDGDAKRPATSAQVAVGAQHRAVLRIELARQLGRADEVAEQHRQLASLGLARNRRSWLSGLGAGIGRPGGQGRYRFEQALAVAQVEPKLLQIGIGQIAQDVARNPVLGERLGMMAKPLFSEPARDVEHFAPQALV
jgi:hypothetical protein